MSVPRLSIRSASGSDRLPTPTSASHLTASTTSSAYTHTHAHTHVTMPLTGLAHPFRPARSSPTRKLSPPSSSDPSPSSSASSSSKKKLHGLSDGGETSFNEHIRHPDDQEGDAKGVVELVSRSLRRGDDGGLGWVGAKPRAHLRLLPSPISLSCRRIIIIITTSMPAILRMR